MFMIKEREDATECTGTEEKSSTCPLCLLQELNPKNTLKQPASNIAASGEVEQKYWWCETTDESVTDMHSDIQ